ncbi:hypothetical protein CHH53_11855 [Terribacillus sp. 7520-G]|nr:hypothetical protein CHH53_11855 [Terribacillus sp. 7520-G]
MSNKILFTIISFKQHIMYTGAIYNEKNEKSKRRRKMLLLLFGLLIVVIITITTPKDLFHSSDDISAAVTQQAKIDAENYINSTRNQNRS